jgi:hypothetical protein
VKWSCTDPIHHAEHCFAREIQRHVGRPCGR